MLSNKVAKILVFCIYILLSLSACRAGETSTTDVLPTEPDVEIQEEIIAPTPHPVERPQPQQPEGLFAAMTDFWTHIVIDRYGNHHPYRMVSPFDGDFAALSIYNSRGGRMAAGLIDNDGNLVVPFIYSQIGAFDFNEDIIFRDGLARVMSLENGGLYGFIDQTGREVVPLIYERAGHFSEGLARVRYGGLDGFIDTTGEVVIPFQYERAQDFSEGLALVRMDGMSGFIDQAGTQVIPFSFDSAFGFNEGLARVWIRSEGETYIDQSGSRVMPQVYDIARSFNDGLAMVMTRHGGQTPSNNRYYFIDREGNIVLSTPYIILGDFSDGLALVNDRYTGEWDEGWGFIDKNGEVVIPLVFTSVGRVAGDRMVFHEGFATVRDIHGLWGAIDRYGNTVVPFEYHSIVYFTSDIIVVNENGEYGIMSADGTVRWLDAINELLAQDAELAPSRR